MTMALVTAVDIEGQGSCTLVFPRELILRGFFTGPPFKRCESVPLADLRRVPKEQSPHLEELLFKCLQQHSAARQRGLEAEDQKRAGSALEEPAAQPGNAGRTAETSQAVELDAADSKVLRVSEVPDELSRDRSRSPRQSTPERHAAVLMRHNSEEKLPVQPGYYPAVQEAEIELQTITSKRLSELTVAVSLQLKQRPGNRIEAKELRKLLRVNFTASELEVGLTALDQKNKILIMDDIIFRID